MKYNTIDTIIDDIFLEMRRNQITESESYSRKQIEQWVIQYRMFILKELSNSKLPISSNYYQKYVVPVSYGTKNDINNPKFGVLTTENKVPDYFCNDLGNTFISSYDMLGNEIQIMSGKRAAANRFRRHANFNMPVAYIASDKKYKLENADNIGLIEIGGIFINPTEVPDFDYDNDMYPMDPSALPRLKQMIFQGELKFNLVPDTENDGREKFVVASK